MAKRKAKATPVAKAAPPAKRFKSEPIDATVFVDTVLDVHKAGGAVKDVAAKLNRSETYVSQRMTQMRKAGIPLPKFKRQGDGGKAVADLIAHVQGRLGELD